MYAQVEKSKENKNKSVANPVTQKQDGGESTFQFVDNRPEAIVQRKLQELANNRPQAKQATQLQVMADNHSTQNQQPIQKKENNTGFPAILKTGREHLSGISLDDVKVHRNSDKPAQLKAHAYAQGTDIHLESGQEKHLPHKAWHEVQQKQGRVEPTMQMKGKVNVNDEAALEKEADVMGAKAAQMETTSTEHLEQKKNNATKMQASKITQLKIHVKSGEKFDRTKPETTAPRLVDIANSPNIYYVRSMEDIEQMKASINVPVLANKKHLIGERHEASRFTDAVANWGWAAGMLIEEYSKHEKLKSPLQTEKERSAITEGVYDQNFVHGKAKALEDTGAKGLTLAVNAKIFGTIMLRLATAFQTQEVFAQTNKAELKTNCTTAWHKCSPLMDLVLTLSSYLLKSSQSFLFHDKKHDLVSQTLTLDLINQVGAGLDNIKEQSEDKNTLHLNPLHIQNFINRADQLVPVMQQLIVAYDNKDFSLEDIQGMTTAAQPGGNTDRGDIGALDPLREKYMRKNINAAKVPSLVKIGRQHVGHMTDNLPANSIPYNDYVDFEAKNTADNVDL